MRVQWEPQTDTFFSSQKVWWNVSFKNKKKMYVCMHVCMHACMYVCMYVKIYSIINKNECKHGIRKRKQGEEEAIGMAKAPHWYDKVGNQNSPSTIFRQPF
uniref:Uncharacterized protein n=1 Tax=Physcomitrium patens TaxID=3218 RepID=A0A2K1KT17_PHYPA|nr:hypothetical protein PHYPA_003920 [Physcomitrium patens]